ncbi:hypothetical protein Hanom_Chr11g01013601 [Helianthus anomalus]
MVINYLRCCVQVKSSNFDARHNICCTLDKTLSKMGLFTDVLEVMERSRINKVLTDRYKCYKSHIENFWKNARFDDSLKTIFSVLKVKDGNKDIDVEVKFIVEDVRRVLEFQDADDDPMQVPERLVKGLWMRMGYAGYVNESQYLKSKLPKPYKFLIH